MFDYISHSTSATAEDIVNQAVPAESSSQEPVAAVSGTIITEEVDTSGNADILAAINAANETHVQSQYEEEERRRREEEEALARIVAKRQQENLERRIQMEAEARQKREEEERLAMEAELAAQSAKSKGFGFFRGKEKTEELPVSEPAVLKEPEEPFLSDTAIPEEDVPAEFLSQDALPEEMPQEEIPTADAIPEEPIPEPAPIAEPISSEEMVPKEKETKSGHSFFRSKSKPVADAPEDAPQKKVIHQTKDSDELILCSSPALTMIAIRINNFFTLPRAEGDTIVRNIERCVQNNNSASIRSFRREDTFFLGAYDVAGETDMNTIRRAIPVLVPSASLFVAARPYQGEMSVEEHNSMLFSELETQLSEVSTTKKEASIPYDERLSNSQRALKQTIMMNHERMLEGEFADVYQSLQRNLNKISIIFLASPDFNTLFIFQDPDEFFTFVSTEVDNIDELDCSYIYALHEGGTVYYGTDDYMDELTSLFQKISAGIMSLDYSASPSAISKAVGKIPGINIFENIYIQ